MPSNQKNETSRTQSPASASQHHAESSREQSGLARREPFGLWSASPFSAIFHMNPGSRGIEVRISSERNGAQKRIAIANSSDADSSGKFRRHRQIVCQACYTA